MASRLVAVVLAAGKGTRMKSDLPKILHPICGQPLALFPIRAALEAGADAVVVVVGHGADRVETALRLALPDAPLSFALQAEQKGTGHAVMSAKAALGAAGVQPDTRVMLLAGDVPLLRAETLRALADAQEKSGSPLALISTEMADATGYGRIIRSADGSVLRVVEEKDASPSEKSVREANASIYCAQAGFLFAALEKLNPQNAQGEYYLTDIVSLASLRAQTDRSSGKAPVAVKAAESEVAGVNDRAQLAWAAARLNARNLDSLMKSGVTVIDPQTTWIDVDVQVAHDVTIEPMVSLRGKSQIGRGALIGQGTIVIDSQIGESHSRASLLSHRAGEGGCALRDRPLCALAARRGDLR